MSEDSDMHTLSTSCEELNALHGIHYEMPTSLDGFYRRYARAQMRYAATILGSKDAAKTVVRSLYTHLALNWSTRRDTRPHDDRADRRRGRRERLPAAVPASNPQPPCA